MNTAEAPTTFHRDLHDAWEAMGATRDVSYADALAWVERIMEWEPRLLCAPPCRATYTFWRSALVSDCVDADVFHVALGDVVDTALWSGTPVCAPRALYLAMHLLVALARTSERRWHVWRAELRGLPPLPAVALPSLNKDEMTVLTMFLHGAVTHADARVAWLAGALFMAAFHVPLVPHSLPPPATRQEMEALILFASTLAEAPQAARAVPVPVVRSSLYADETLDTSMTMDEEDMKIHVVV